MEGLPVLVRLLIILFTLPLASCATRAVAPVRPNVYVMRHLHTPAGASNPDLTPEGERAARMLAVWFERDPPKAIYVSSTQRAQQTAALVAQRFSVAPKIYDPLDTPSLVAAALRDDGAVLIVGHSNTVPDIVEQLGGTRPTALSHEDFGDIWHVSGSARFTTRAKLAE